MSPILYFIATFFGSLKTIYPYYYILAYKCNVKQRTLCGHVRKNVCICCKLAGEIVFGLVFCLSGIICRSNSELTVSLINFDTLWNLRLMLSFTQGY